MFSQKKPYTAVTVNIENLTSENYNVDDLSGIPDLVDVVKIQASGPSEAARAIRKKLKYGNVHRQLRALVILDGLIQNAGPHFQRAFADEPLLERLRVCGTSGLSDPAVRRKCTEMFREWSQYASTPGLERVARLHKELPKRKVAVTQDMSKVIRETENPFGDDEEEEAAERASRPSAAEPSSKLRHSQTALGPDHPSAKAGEKKHTKDKHKSKRKVNRGAFSLEAEKDKIKSIIAESFIESTNLMNSLQSINRERQRISENRDALEHFEACKQLRRRILRHVNPQPWAPLLHLFGHASHMIHLVESEQWLGSLLHANDELVHALMSFEQLDQSIDADSDSDDELAHQAHIHRMAALRTKDDDAHPHPSTHAPDLAGLSRANTQVGWLPCPPPPRLPHGPSAYASPTSASI